MPMIDAYAAAGTFGDKHKLAVDLATAVMTIEQVPEIPMFRKNTSCHSGWSRRGVRGLFADRCSS